MEHPSRADRHRALVVTIITVLLGSLLLLLPLLLQKAKYVLLGGKVGLR